MPFNMRGLEESDGEIFHAVPAGNYPCRVAGIDLKVTSDQSKNPGKPQYVIDLKVLAGHEHENAGFRIWRPVPLKEGEDQDGYMDAETYQRRVDEWKRLYMACNATTKGDEVSPEEDLMECELIAVVSVQQYQNKDTNKVDDVLPVE